MIYKGDRYPAASHVTVPSKRAHKKATKMVMRIDCTVHFTVLNPGFFTQIPIASTMKIANIIHRGMNTTPQFQDTAPSVCITINTGTKTIIETRNNVTNNTKP
jgi:hypothetical protein